MRSYWAHIRIHLKLTFRDRLVVFFNYVFPLLFFFIFAQVFGSSRSAAFTQVVSMVLIIGVLGNGFFGAGIRAIQDRELNILRRYKVAPITPTPLLLASIITGWVNYLPMALLVLGLSHFGFGMAFPANWISLLAFLSLGIICFRAIGLMIASVVNSAQEGQILIQLFYFPMLLLSGATLPFELLPAWAQRVAQFLPASYLCLGLQGILLRGENLAENWQAVLALAITTLAATFLSVKLFRWEKEERIRGTAKLWLLAGLLPFLLLGAWEAHTQNSAAKVRALTHEMRRNQIYLIRDARIFTGDEVVDSGAVLLRGGKIIQLWRGPAPPAKTLHAELIEGAGKTLLPAFIDAHVMFQGEPSSRDLAAYLYCGVAAVGVSGDLPQTPQGELGAELVQAVSSSEGVYVSALTAAEMEDASAAGGNAIVEDSLVQQVAPAGVLEEWKRRVAGSAGAGGSHLQRASQKLIQAWKAGRALAAASCAGFPPLVHGPGIHRELQLWVKAGIPAYRALAAATAGNAKLLGLGDRMGRIAPGYDATLVLVNGNPLTAIDATENIAAVFFKGERVIRSELLERR